MTSKTGNNWTFRLTQLKVFTATSKFTAKAQKHETMEYFFLENMQLLSNGASNLA